MEKIPRRANWVLLGWLVAATPAVSALGYPTDVPVPFTNTVVTAPTQTLYVVFPVEKVLVAFAFNTVNVAPVNDG